MSQSKDIKTLFHEYDKESGGCALFGGCSRSYISLGAKSRVLTVTAHLDEYFDAAEIEKTAKGLKDFYGFGGARIFPVYDVSLMTPENLSDVLSLFPNVTAKSLLGDADIDVAEDAVTVTARHSLASIDTDLLKRFIKTSFGYGGEVVVKSEVSSSVKEERERELESYRESVKNAVKSAPKAEKPKAKSGKPNYRVKKEITENTLYGYNSKSLPVPIKELDFEASDMCFEGFVFGYDKSKNRLTRDEKRSIIIFNVTDYTGSLKVKVFDSVDRAVDLADGLENGLHVKLTGSMEYDDFQRVHLFRPRTVEKTPYEEKTDDAPEKRIELHCHTNMSTMDAVASAEELVEKAVRYGHKALAITDHGSVQSFPDAMKAAKGKDIKIIYGMEGYLVEDDFKTLREKKQKIQSHHIIFLVKNAVGLKNLYKMVSESSVDCLYKSRPMTTRSMVEKYREGLLIGTACSEGELYKMILEGKSDDEIIDAIKMYDYLEVQPIQNDRYLIEGERKRLSGEQALRDIVERIIRIAKKTDRLFVATGDVHFLNERDEIYRRVIQAGLGFSDCDRQPPLYYKTTDEMLSLFDFLDPETAREAVIVNPAKIADMIEDVKPITSEFCPPVIEGSEEELKRLTYGKAYEIYGDPLPGIVSDRIDKELGAIIKYNFSVMYIIAQKLVSKSLSDGYLVGSRGSVGSSFVAFLSGITEVNSLKPHYVCPKCKYSDFDTDPAYGVGVDMPEKDCPRCGARMKKDGWDIPFETFLGFAGDKTPDIDLNFSGEYQPVAHKFVEELFGEGHVFRAGTIGALADKTAFGFVKKYFEGRNEIVSDVEIERIVNGCLGIKRTTGQHPGGIIVVPKDREITDFCPIQHPADDADSPIITTHFDYHKIDKNLLKLDILGHDDPTMLRILEDLTGVDPKSIPIYDEKVLSIFTSRKALDFKKDVPISDKDETGALLVPEFGTDFVRGILADTKPTTVEELIRISGLSHGTDVWQGNCDELIKSHTATLKEAICTRDDIMLYLLSKNLPAKSSFDIMEAVRKGKGLKPEWEELMREHEVPEWYINSCKKIKYMFPKAHAVAYVTTALRLTYYKIYYPIEFYCAYFSVRGDNFDATVMIKGEEAAIARMRAIKQDPKASNKDKDSITVLEACVEFYRRGFSFLPIDLERSDAARFAVVGKDKLLPPLSSLPGIGKNAALVIAEERKKGSFETVESFKQRTGVTKTVTEALTAEGVFEGIPESSQLCFF